MTKFSANLGFLFTELPLPDAIESAAHHGFDAVECHFPYSTPADDTIAALKKTGLRMLGLNTIKGDESKGDNGLCALPERIEEARASIDQAIDYVIEPLNPYDAPGYYLNTTDQAVKVIEAVSAENLKLMFDCYHVQIIEGDVSRRMKTLLPIIGHIQIASVPARAEPDKGALG